MLAARELGDILISANLKLSMTSLVPPLAGEGVEMWLSGFHGSRPALSFSIPSEDCVCQFCSVLTTSQWRRGVGWLTTVSSLSCLQLLAAFYPVSDLSTFGILEEWWKISSGQDVWNDLRRAHLIITQERGIDPKSHRELGCGLEERTCEQEDCFSCSMSNSAAATSPPHPTQPKRGQWVCSFLKVLNNFCHFFENLKLQNFVKKLWF